MVVVRVVEGELGGGTLGAILEAHAEGRQHLVAQRVAQPEQLFRQRCGRLALRSAALAPLLRVDGAAAHLVTERAERLRQLQRRGGAGRAGGGGARAVREVDAEGAHRLVEVARDAAEQCRAAPRVAHRAHVAVGRADELLERLG